VIEMTSKVAGESMGGGVATARVFFQGAHDHPIKIMPERCDQCGRSALASLGEGGQFVRG
jgi:hypothetical protein